MKPRHEVAQIIRLHRKAFEQHYQLPVQVKRTLTSLTQCRTAALGGHMECCTNCGQVKVSYNSCRNRHCPKCQAIQREKWIIAREAELLPVPYYHMVFTLPACFNELLPKYAKGVYSSLFKASWGTIQDFAQDPKYLGAKTGVVAILHTWGQQLWLHPHLHCIVPAGGVTKGSKWKCSRQKGKYLFPKRALSQVFRAKFMALLREQIHIPRHIAKQAFEKSWVVYAKRPFTKPEHVIEYLGRYTHKIAISNHRLTSVDQDSVCFNYKDYRQAGKQKQCSLSGVEFLRRFSQHILPAGFVRIRHYGILASRNKATLLNEAKKDLQQPRWEKVAISWQEIAEKRLAITPNTCTCCKTPTMVIVSIINPERGPPVK